MKFHKIFFTSIMIISSSAVKAESLNLQNLYDCLTPTSNKDYWSTLTRQMLEISQLSTEKWPEVSFEMSKTSDALKSDSQEPGFVRIGAQQIIYDKSANRRVDTAEATLDTLKWQKTSSKIDEVKNAFQSILFYYKLLEEKRILEQKISRQTRLVSVLRDLVKSKITDGVLLTLSESDLSLLEIKLNELDLRHQKIQKSFLVPTQITTAIKNGTVLKIISQLATMKKFSRGANKAKIEALESQKRQIKLEDKSNSDYFLPRLDFGLNYYSYLEKSAGIKPADELQLKLQLSLNISDFFSSSVYTKNQMQQYEYTQALLSDTTLKLSIDDEFNSGRINQIESSLKDLIQVKNKIEKAKDVLSKKLLMNRASYSDYISVDDKLDDIDLQITSMQFEKLQLIINNDAESKFSNMPQMSANSCPF